MQRGGLTDHAWLFVYDEGMSNTLAHHHQPSFELCIAASLRQLSSHHTHHDRPEASKVCEQPYPSRLAIATFSRWGSQINGLCDCR